MQGKRGGELVGEDRDQMEDALKLLCDKIIHSICNVY